MAPFFAQSSDNTDSTIDSPSQRRTRFASDSFSMPRPPSDLLWDNAVEEDEDPPLYGPSSRAKRVSFAPEVPPIIEPPSEPVHSKLPEVDHPIESDSEASSDSDNEPDERTPILPTFMRRPRPPNRTSTTPSPDNFRPKTWFEGQSHTFTFPRGASAPLLHRLSALDYGAITNPTDDLSPQRPRTQWRKSFIFSKRKSEAYDDDGLDNATGTGMRVWYEDYTTIDWIHDFTKERVRLRALRSIPGLKGSIRNYADAAQAWILLALIGVACGCIASSIDIAYSLLSDLRTGYCESNFFATWKNCCAGSEEGGCTDWITWPDHFNDSAISHHSQYISYVMYTLSGILFATASALVVKLSRTSPVDPDKASASTEPSWVTTAREQRGLRRSRSKDAQMRKKRKVIYTAAGSGIPEVKTILGGFVIRGFLGIRTLLVKVFALMLSISSGLVVGAQGPLVHISCAVGNVLSRLFSKYAKNEGKRREILSAASAAGVAVAFGAPLGGVLFALEEVSYYFPLKTMWRSFFCALVAAGTVRMINPLGGGKVVLFQVEWEGATTMGGVWRAWEVLPFALVGILGGLYGAMFIKLTAAWSRVRARTWLGRWPVLEVMLVAGITAAIGYMWDLTRMGTGELVAELFSQCTSDSDSVLCRSPSLGSTLEILFQTLLVKLVLTVVTFGVKVPAGIFIPSMCVGALIGRMVGSCVQYSVQTWPEYWLFDACGAGGNCVVPGVYAVVGAAAAVSGVTRMTVSLTVIILELTGSLPSLLPAMLCIMLAKWVGDAFSPLALFETAIIAGGYPYLDAKRGVRTKGEKRWTVVDVIEKQKGKKIVRCGVKYKLDELEKIIYGVNTNGRGDTGSRSALQQDGGYPIVDENDILVGYIATPEMTHALHLVKSKHPEWPIILKRPEKVPSISEREIVDRRVDLEGLLNAVGARGRSPVGRTGAPGWRPATPERSNDRSGSRNARPAGRPASPSPPTLFARPSSPAPTPAFTLPPAGPSLLVTDTLSTDTAQEQVHDLTPWMDTAPLTVPHTASLDLVHELFVKLGIKTLCVVCDGKLIGVVHKKGVVAFLRGEDGNYT